MAGIRPARTIRNMNKVPWTRFSKTKPRRSFIKAMPHKDLNVYRMGARKTGYDREFSLVAFKDITIRDNAIESARQAANKFMEKTVPLGYYFVVRVFPHHVIRENKMIAGAGADRLQKGMRQSFGRPTDRAARIPYGQAIFTVYTIASNEATVKTAFERAKKKLGGLFKMKTVKGENIGA
jgi:large subunit ribosomal protein L10e